MKSAARNDTLCSYKYISFAESERANNSPNPPQAFKSGSAAQRSGLTMTQPAIDRPVISKVLVFSRGETRQLLRQYPEIHFRWFAVYDLLGSERKPQECRFLPGVTDGLHPKGE